MEGFQTQMSRARSTSNSSIGSGSTAPGSPLMSLKEEEDRLVRYNKLLVEYSKCKQKVVVLKQGILKEKERNEQHEKMMRDKEVFVRSSMEKIDFLEFANTKLSKTVTALQDEIQELKSNSGGSWFGGGKKQLAQKDEELKILRIELEAKIQENAHLHTRLSDQRKESNDQSELLNAKLISMKNLLTIKTEEAEEARSSLGAEKQQFFDQNQMLRESISQMEEVLQQNRLEIVEKEKEMTKMNNKLREEVEESKQRLRNKLPFDDSERVEFNFYNLSELQLKQKKRNLELGNRILLSFGDMKDGFKDFHSLVLDRSNKFLASNSNSEGLKGVHKKLNEVFIEHHKVFTQLYEVVDKVVRTWKDEEKMKEEELKELLEAFRRWLNCKKNLLGIELLRLEEENKLKGVSASMQTRNSLLSESHYQIYHHLEAFVLSPLTTLCNFEGPPFTVSKYSQLLESSLIHLDSFEKAFKTLINQINSKANDPEIAEVQFKISSALTDIVSCVRIAFETAGEVPVFPVRGYSFTKEDAKSLSEINLYPSLHKMRNRTSHFLFNLNQVEEPKRISFDEAAKNANTLIEIEEEMRRREEKVKEIQERLANVENEKGNLENELVSFRDDIASRQTQSNSLLSELASTRSKLEKINEQHRSALSEKEEAEKLFKDSLEDKEKQYKVLQEQLKSLQEQRVKAEEKEKARIQQEKERTQQEKERIQQEREKIREEREKVSLLQKEKSELEANLAAANASVAATTAALNAANAEKGEEQPVVIPEPQIIYVQKEAERIVVDTLEQSVQTEEEELPERSESETQTDFMEKPPVAIPQPVVSSPIVETPKTVEKPLVSTETNKDYFLVVMDSNGNQFNSLNVSETDKERERALKEFYDFKLEKVTSQMALLDARSIQLFHAYKQSLSKLQKVVEEKQKMESKLNESDGKLTMAKEDLDLTRKNYEQQMNLFTEHITSQSETISTQETEIFALKNMLKASKGKK
eukprot:TRINITY_DN2721_c0_g1_i1.p1 TRINITY_DN2721_c0_g1~~TRINITY_DN2721_c0_g1_i1.p1  ORF type:complete len:985 (-),score=449.99 TRINITY_DN2721_c0_g1_i1:37-2991(-)